MVSPVGAAALAFSTSSDIFAVQFGSAFNENRVEPVYGNVQNVKWN